MPSMLPPLDGGEYMISLAQQMGWCGHGGMGPVPLSALEVSAWCDGTGEDLTQWEFATILKLSRAYVGGTQAKLAPWEPMVVKMALASAAFGSMAVEQPQKRAKRR